MKTHTKNCENCNTDFNPKRSDAKYCCNSCRQNKYLESISGVFFEKSKRHSQERLTAELLLLTNDILFLFLKKNIIYSQIETIFQKATLLKINFESMPEHQFLACRICEFCHSLITIMNERRERVLNIESPQSEVLNHLNEIVIGAKKSFGFVFTS